MTGRWRGLLLAAWLLGGCDSPQIKDCEAQLLDKLKAPSSYQRIKAEGIALTTAAPPYYLVTIEYDAQNSYGAALRDTERCSYRMTDRAGPTVERFDPYANIVAEDVSVAAPPVDTSIDKPIDPAPATNDVTAPDEEPAAYEYDNIVEAYENGAVDGH